jgi:hypothetical protein
MKHKKVIAVILLLLVGLLPLTVAKALAYDNRTPYQKCVDDCIAAQTLKHPGADQSLIGISCAQGCYMAIMRYGNLSDSMTLTSGGTQCCRCCLGARQEKDCVDIMEVNKCRNRGGTCTNYMPCWGRE